MTSQLAQHSRSNLQRLNKPKRSIMRTEDSHLFHGKIRFTAIQDHILESQCQCESATSISCLVCKYENELLIPHLPEMIFPHNNLILALRYPNGSEKPFLQFNAFDALRLVKVGELPDVKVQPSAKWQEARKDVSKSEFQKPFDWTFTSFYEGSVVDGMIREETTEEAIDFEKLKQHEPILFYSQMTLFEDELSDHGCSQMTVRVRVMPNSFFILCRFYLRVDGVMVRIHDTRLYAESNWSYILRESSMREAAFQKLSQNDLKNVLDANLIWQSLPQIFMNRTKLVFPP